MKKRFQLCSLLIALFLGSGIGFAQTKGEVHHYLVLFKDKALRYVSLGDSVKFLSAEALARRGNLGIGVDSLDLPVTAAYLENIQSDKVQILYPTRWLNGAVIRVTEHDAARILKIKFFVDRVIYLGSRPQTPGLKSGISETVESPPESVPFVAGQYGQSLEQIAMLGLDSMHAQGFLGEGVRIAVFDAGFLKADRLKAFEHLRKRVNLHVWDLVDFDGKVFEDDAHGMHVLGCMAAWIPGMYMGTAPAAEYYLFRTEQSASETLLEELNWVRAAEMSDSLGIDIICSSLGYTVFDHPLPAYSQSDLDGQTSFVAKGAKIAVSKGMTVVNSAGNDGNKVWEKLNTPADVEEVISVGAVDVGRNASDFTSMGPTADGRMKPDISALGTSTAIVATYGGVYRANGTSYSTPLIAGMVACLLEKHPDAGPHELRQAILFSGSHFANPDTLTGSGVANARLASYALGASDGGTPRIITQSQQLNCAECNLSVVVPGAADQLLYLNVYQRRKFLFIRYYRLLEVQYFRRMGNLARVSLNHIDTSRDLLLLIGNSPKIQPGKEAWFTLNYPRSAD